MSNTAQLAIALAGIALFALGLLAALARLDDKSHPYEPDDHESFFGELLEDADAQEMRAKRRGHEGR